MTTCNGAPPIEAAQEPQQDAAQMVVRTKKKKAAEEGAGGAGLSVGAPEDPNAPAPTDQVKVIPISKNHEFFQEGWRPVQVSAYDKAPGITLGEDMLSITSHKGYRMARGSHGVYKGSYYFEVEVKHLGETGHCRLGWAKRKAELQAPVGYDEHGFCYRDVEGVKVHKAFRESYGEPYQEGDVIGCVLHMPPGGKALELNKEDIVWWKGQPFLKDETATDPQPLVGSFVGFCKNGVFQGKAYEDIKEGTYYPAASLYTMPHQFEGATVTFNFGPSFKFAPPTVPDCPEFLAASTLAGEPPSEAKPELKPELQPEPQPEPKAEPPTAEPVQAVQTQPEPMVA